MYSRKLLFVLLLLGMSMVGGLIARNGTVATWQLWHVPASNPTFMDARVITAGAVATRRGLDPLVENPTDEAQRPLNYPRIWQALYRLGLDEHDDRLLGAIFVGLGAVGLLLFCAQLREPPVLLLLFAIFSPAIALGLDRGNTDLVVFCLLSLMLATLRRRPGAAFACVVIAFILKLFPLAALAGFLGLRRPTAQRYLAAAVALAVLYLLFSYQDLLLIRAGTPRSTWLTYGSDVLALKFSPDGTVPAASWQHLSWSILTAAGALAAWLGWRRPSPSALGTATHGFELDAFRVGASCYVGTFLLGNNFDYRLMFLIFAIPQLARWARSVDGLPRWWARAALLGTLAAMWALFYEAQFTDPASLKTTVSFVGGEIGAWIAFLAILQLLAASLPRWVRRPLGAAPSAESSA